MENIYAPANRQSDRLVPVDNTVLISTPEGIDIEQQIAGPLVRAMALLLDTLFKLVIQFTCYYLLTLLGYSGAGLFMLLLFSLEWFYAVLFEVLWNGQTPGKAAMSIRVIHDDGTPISWRASMLRNLVRFVDLLPFAYQLGCISMVLSRDFKRLGDWVAGTLVVYSGTRSDDVLGCHNTETPRAQPMAPPIPMRSDEQLAIIRFNVLSQRVSESRAFEIANLLFPITQCKNEKAVKQLQRMASWFRGVRQ